MSERASEFASSPIIRSSRFAFSRVNELLHRNPWGIKTRDAQRLVMSLLSWLKCGGYRRRWNKTLIVMFGETKTESRCSENLL